LRVTCRIWAACGNPKWWTPPAHPDRHDEGQQEARRAQVGDVLGEAGEPGLPVADEEHCDRLVDQLEFVAGEDVLEHGPEGPAGGDQRGHAEGQRQAQRPAGLQPPGQEGQLALVAVAELGHPRPVQ
jgi:hypothetical protein